MANTTHANRNISNDDWEGGVVELSDKFASAFEPWGDYLFGIIMIIIGVVSVVGNSLAIHVFRCKGDAITSAELLMLNIAAVDLFLAVASYPAPIVASFSHYWIFGEIGCTLYAATCFFLGLATISSLTLLAVFRLIKTCFPCRDWLTMQRTRQIIWFIYAYSLLWAAAPLLGWGNYDVEPFGLSCTLDWKNQTPGGKSYILSVSAVCVFLPALTIVGSHLGILLVIRRNGDLFLNRAVARQSREAEKQFIQISFCVCFGFLIAWIPYACFSLWSAYGDNHHIPLWMTPIPVLLAKSSIAYNPFIYGCTTKRYRVDFNNALRQLCSCFHRDAHVTLNATVTQKQAQVIVLYSKSPNQGSGERPIPQVSSQLVEIQNN